LQTNKLLTMRSVPLDGSLPLWQQQISNERYVSGAVRKYKHWTTFLNRNATAETPVAAPKGIQKYRRRRTFGTVDFRLKDQEKIRFWKFRGKMARSEGWYHGGGKQVRCRSLSLSPSNYKMCRKC